MNNRQRKKLSRHTCPTCRTGEGIWRWHQLKTGRWVSVIVDCFSDYCLKRTGREHLIMQEVGDE